MIFNPLPTAEDCKDEDDVEMWEAADRINLIATENTLWTVMEQSLRKFRQMQLRRSFQVNLKERLLIKETFRMAVWELACLRAIEDGDDAHIQKIVNMAKLSEQCLSRVGMLGRLRISIDPGPLLDGIPSVKIMQIKHQNNLQ